MNSHQCGGGRSSSCKCSGSRHKFVSALLWLSILFLTTLFTLLFIMCFIHFLKNSHTPIVSNDLQDYSTTKSIYFLLSFYFLLWSVVYLGCTVFVVVRKKSGNQSEKPGKVLLIVLLILLAIITLLLCTIDRLYSPWIWNFMRGKIFEYCVQVSALITLIFATCYFLTCAVSFLLCSKDKGLLCGGTSSAVIHNSHQTSMSIRMVQEDTPLKSSFTNPCYNIEYSLNDGDECVFNQNVTQAIVSLLFVQYFFVYLDSELDDKSRMFNSSRCLYFFLLTLLGCLVFAGIQRRSIVLLKWPSRFLVTLLIIGLVSLTIYLWVLDKKHQSSVRDLEGKTLKFSLVIIVLLLYSGGIQRLITQLNRPAGMSSMTVSTSITSSEGFRTRGGGSSFNANTRFIFDQSDHNNYETHPMITLLTESFRKKTGGKEDKKAIMSTKREINVASNGVNYYQLLLEGNVQTSTSSSGCGSSGKNFGCSKDCKVSYYADGRLSGSESTGSITEV